LPGLRPPRRGLRSGGFSPGSSSVLGGIEEFPELREISRSSRATRSASSAFRAFSSAICASLSSSSIRRCSFASRSRPFPARSAAASPGRPGASGVSGTPELHQSRPFVNKHDTPTWPARLLRHPASALAGELMLSFMAPQAGIGDDRGMFAMTA